MTGQGPVFLYYLIFIVVEKILIDTLASIT